MRKSIFIFLSLLVILTSSLQFSKLSEIETPRKELNGIYDFSEYGYLAYLFESDEFDFSIVAFKYDKSTKKMTNFSQNFVDIGCTRRPHFINNSMMYCLNDNAKEFYQISPKLPLTVANKWPLTFFSFQADWLDPPTGYLSNLGINMQGIFNWTIFNTSNSQWIGPLIFDINDYAPGFQTGGYEITPDHIYPYAFNSSGIPNWFEFDLHDISKGMIRRIEATKGPQHHTNVIKTNTFVTMLPDSIITVPIDGSEGDQWVTNDPSQYFNRLNESHICYIYNKTVGAYTTDDNYKFVQASKTDISQFLDPQSNLTIVPPLFLSEGRYMDVIATSGNYQTYIRADIIDENSPTVQILYPDNSRLQYFPSLQTDSSSEITPYYGGFLINKEKQFSSHQYYQDAYYYDLGKDKVFGISNQNNQCTLTILDSTDGSFTTETFSECPGLPADQGDIVLLRVEGKANNILYYNKKTQEVVAIVNGQADKYQLNFKSYRNILQGGFLSDYSEIWVASVVPYSKEQKNSGAMFVTKWSVKTAHLILDQGITINSFVADADYNRIIYTENALGKRSVSLFDIEKLAPVWTVPITETGFSGVAPLGKDGFIVFGRDLLKAYDSNAKPISISTDIIGDVYVQAVRKSQFTVVTYNRGFQKQSVFKVNFSNEEENGKVEVQNSIVENILKAHLRREI